MIASYSQQFYGITRLTLGLKLNADVYWQYQSTIDKIIDNRVINFLKKYNEKLRSRKNRFCILKTLESFKSPFNKRLLRFRLPWLWIILLSDICLTGITILSSYLFAQMIWVLNVTLLIAKVYVFFS